MTSRSRWSRGSPKPQTNNTSYGRAVCVRLDFRHSQLIAIPWYVETSLRGEVSRNKKRCYKSKSVAVKFARFINAESL
jgi:hypothetical protein